MTKPPWRPRRWNPVDSRPGGLPGVAWDRQYTRAIAYAAYAAASSIFGRFLSAAHGGIATYSYGLLPGLSESTRLPHRRRMRYRQLPTIRATPVGVRGPICPRKKCAIWTRWRLVPVKNVNYQRAPKNRNSGLVGPHTTPPIVDYKYMASTPREGYFGLPTLGT